MLDCWFSFFFFFFCLYCRRIGLGLYEPLLEPWIKNFEDQVGLVVARCSGCEIVFPFFLLCFLSNNTLFAKRFQVLVLRLEDMADIDKRKVCCSLDHDSPLHANVQFFNVKRSFVLL